MHSNSNLNRCGSERCELSIGACEYEFRFKIQRVGNIGLSQTKQYHQICHGYGIKCNYCYYLLAQFTLKCYCEVVGWSDEHMLGLTII